MRLRARIDLVHALEGYVVARVSTVRAIATANMLTPKPIQTLVKESRKEDTMKSNQRRERIKTDTSIANGRTTAKMRLSVFGIGWRRPITPSMKGKVISTLEVASSNNG